MEGEKEREKKESNHEIEEDEWIDREAMRECACVVCVFMTRFFLQRLERKYRM